MSQVRAHNFSISLDGFGTGDGITFDAPFGHAGERLHAWMFATRFWRSMVGKTGGTSGVDHSFADRHSLGFGAEIMGRGKFGPQTGPWTDVGTDDGPGAGARPRRRVARLGGADPAVPHTGVRAHAPLAPVDRDGGRHHLPLRRRQPAGGARPRPRGSRRPRRAHRRWPDRRPRLPRR